MVHQHILLVGSGSLEFQSVENWLHILYILSSFAATDPRDVVYGLRGMMRYVDGGWLLGPSYSKSTEEIFLDSVAAGHPDRSGASSLFGDTMIAPEEGRKI
ncbi:hypothetical protein F5Y19DRAFT_481399 [Xylariaceae sp. FL1651]|nr:hypothetical protein F5Y19DRAFT_481399 [Xylariaceae sp. FL1651]